MVDVQEAAAEAARTPSFVVGIGASAGGLKALESLLGAMPADSGMAFVVVQHLSPNFKSAMDSLLSRHTTMSIHGIEDGMRIEADSIYLIPPKTQLSVVGGRLRLTERDLQAHLTLPIDVFLSSLADDYHERAVAIVLSGTGTDGSRGIQAVSDANGFVLAQLPESAQFDGMPRAAIATGVVDAIARPEEMPQILERYAADPQYRPVAAATPVELPGDAHATILSLLHSRYGIDFSRYKETTVGRRIQRRMGLSQRYRVAEYLDLLSTSPNELDLLYRDLLIRVTEFFRNPDAYDALAKLALPGLFKDLKANSEVRAWSAGCATGEEAYSLAILLREAATAHGFDGKITLFATDVHRPSLGFAAAGIYPKDRLPNVSDSRLERHFVQVADGQYRIATELRKMVLFAPHNIMSDPPFTKMDLVSCRNLLIYLDDDAQNRAIASFHFALRTGGILFQGNSEGLGRFKTDYDTLDGHWRVLRKVRASRVALHLSMPPNAGSTTVGMAASSRAVGMDRRLLADYDHLLRRYMPTGVLVDAERRPLHYFGDAGAFLKRPDGRATDDILRSLPESLSLAVSSLLHRAERSKAGAQLRKVDVSQDGTRRDFDVGVEPLGEAGGEASHYFISITDSPSGPPPDASQADKDDEEFSLRGEWVGRVKDLETELQFTRENLQTTIEELQSSNEELQATNEEMLAANEELQSTNEELQSVNEELFTVNAEFEKKNEELANLNATFDDLIGSLRVALVGLDPELRVVWFSPTIDTFFELRSTDVGRPIGQIAYRLKGESELLEDVRTVLRTGQFKQTQLTVPDGRRFELRIRPVKKGDDASLGVVLMYYDVTGVQHAEDASDRDPAHLSAALDAAEIGTWQLDVSRELVKFDREWANRLGYDSPTLIGASVNGGPYLTLSQASWAALAEPGDMDHFMQQLAPDPEGHDPVFEAGVRFRPSSGGWTTFNLRGRVLLRGTAGRPVSVAGVYRGDSELRGVSERVAPSATEESSPRARSRTLVLLVDDQAENAQVVADFLATEQIDVLQARDGVEGVGVALEHEPDVVVTDVQMPQSSGLELITRLKQDPRTATTPILALTALAGSEDRDRCLAAGADGFLAKPVSLRRLLDEIRSHAQSRNQPRAEGVPQ